jgi:zinc transport system ATP-binding protein
MAGHRFTERDPARQNRTGLDRAVNKVFEWFALRHDAAGGACPGRAFAVCPDRMHRYDRRPPAGETPYIGQAMAETVIDIRGVNFSYETEPVLREIDLHVSSDEFAVVVGPNGGGKTTLLKLILGLLDPDCGTVRVFGKPPRRAVDRMAYTPQHMRFDSSFPVNVRDVVLMGTLGPGRHVGRYNSDDYEAAADALQEVDAESLADRPFSELSGGQQQRVLIARALAGRPDLMLMDEPTSHLDPRTESELHDLLHELNERLTIMLVSHDVGFVCGAVHSVICVNRTITTHTTRELTAEHMADLYGRHVRMVDHASHCLGEASDG